MGLSDLADLLLRSGMSLTYHKTLVFSHSSTLTNSIP